MPLREDIRIHIETLYNNLGIKQAQADLKATQIATEQTTQALSRQEATYLSTAKAAQESAIVDTILARAKQELAAITAMQTAGTMTEAEAEQALLTLRQSTIAALTQYMSAAQAEITLLSATTLSARDLASAQAQLTAQTEQNTVAAQKNAAAWKLVAQNRLMLPGSLGLFRLYGPVAAIAGITLLIGGLKGATDAAEKEEKALVSLSATLQNITPRYQQVTAAVHDLTLKLAYQSLFTHEELIDGYQRLIALGVPLTQAFDLLTTAADLATARNIGLENAVEALGRGFAGQTMRLSRLGIVMWDSTGKVKSFEQVVDELNKRFGGTAANQMDSYTGRMHQYAVAAEEAKKALGELILKWKEALALGIIQIIAPVTPDLMDDLIAAKARLAALKQEYEEFKKTGIFAPGAPPFPEAVRPEYYHLYDEAIAKQEEYVKQLEKQTKAQEDAKMGYTGLMGAINRYTDSLTSAGQKSKQEISQEYQEYKDLIDMYSSLLEQTSRAGDVKAWQQYKESAIEAIDSIIEKEEELLKAQEAYRGGMNLYLRNYIQQLKEARQKIVETTFYEPQIKLLTARVDYAQAIGDTKLLVFTRQELLKVYDQEIKDLTQIIISGQATVETWEKLYEVSTKQAGVVADIRQDMLAMSQFKFQQAEFGFKYGTAGTEEYLAAIDQRIKDIREQQQGLNQDSQEYMELQNEINSLLLTRKETVDNIAQAEENYNISLAEYTAKLTGNQKELLNFYQQYRKELEAQLAALISGTEEYWAMKQKILGVDEKILDITNDIAATEKEAAEEAAQQAKALATAISSYNIALAKYNVKTGAGTQQDVIKALREEQAMLQKELARTNKQTAEYYELKMDILNIDSEIYDITQEIAEAEREAAEEAARAAEEAKKMAQAAKEAEISYYETAARNAMEYYQGKDQTAWERAKRDYLEALDQEKSMLNALLRETAKGSAEYWSILSELNNLEYERLRTIEEEFNLEKGITNELRTQMGLFNLPEFVRFGLPMALAPQIQGVGSSAMYQTNNINITGGYQMTAEEIANAISNSIQNFSNMAGAALWYGH